MDTCTVCCEYTTSYIVCSYCKFQACETCNQKFIEDRPREPLCMNCGKIWSREFVLKNVRHKKWFFQHIGKYILEQEKMLLPETQEEASLISHIQELSRWIKTLPSQAQLKRKYKSLGTDGLNKIIEEKRDIHYKAMVAINSVKEKTITYGNIQTTKVRKENHYIFKCPGDCRGFIADNYKCGTCKCLVCKKCRVQIDEEGSEHICNEDDIKSSELVSSLTKPCPKCMSPILKSGGCDQMFCVLCHSAFSWDTGEIESGIIHNPHYYEYLSTLTTRDVDIDVIACGEIPDALTFMTKVTAVTPSGVFLTKLSQLHRIATHIRYVVSPSWQVNKVKDNIDIRVQYLLEEIDESTWESKLLYREKKRMKINAFRDLIQLVMTILDDSVRRIFALDINNIEEWHISSSHIIVEAVSLGKYYQSSLADICKVYGGAIPIELSNAFRI